MNSAGRSIHLLGYAGLIPFVAAALLAATGSPYAAPARAVGEAYAFGIISFLCGSWWGMALEPGRRRALWLSNGFFLLALFVFLFARDWWSLAAAVLLLAILLTEFNTLRLPARPGYYRRMRTILTLVASASMLALQLAR